MMANQENRASGPAPPGHEHHPAPRHEHHHATIVAGSHSGGGETTDANRTSDDDSPAVSDQPKTQLSNLAAEARDQSTRLASEVIAQTAKLAGEAGQQVNRLMTAQKNRAANGLHRLACALRDTTQNREQNDVGGQIATSDRAAARIESMSTYMRGTDFPTMVRDAGQFARRRPEVLLAGTILTGLLVASLLKASRRGAAETWTPATGRWHTVLQKGTQAVSAAADTLKQGAEGRGVGPEAVVEKVTGLGSGKYVAIAVDRLMGRKHESDNVVEKRSRGGQEAIR
jgi:hypothetical protein